MIPRNKEDQLLLAVDIGGTKIAAGVIDKATGHPL